MPDPSRPELDVWQRLEGAIATPTPAAGTPTTTSAKQPAQPKTPPSHRSRAMWRFLDLLGILLWLYIFTKLFVADVDRLIVEAIDPQLVGLLNYRLVGVLVLLLAVAFLFRRFWLYITYVALYPFVVLFIKVPYYLIRHRSWPLFLGIAQSVTALLTDVRYNATTKIAWFIAAIFIVTTHQPVLIVPSAIVLAGLMAWSIARRLRRLFSAPSFISVQRNLIRRTMTSPRFQTALALGDEYKSADIERYDSNQAQSVTTNIAYGIALNKGLLLWAYQLNRYRKRFAPALMFNLISYAWLFIATVATLFLLNVALLKVRPDEFVTEGPRPLAAVFVYALGTLSPGGEAGGMHPAGSWAYVLQAGAGIAGVLYLATLAVNLFVSYVRERDETATQQLVDELREQAREHESRFKREYSVSIDEAYRRLRRLGAATAGLVEYIVRALPTEGENGE
jgi:hypothetical protein